MATILLDSNQAGVEINQLQWSAAQPDWIGIAFSSKGKRYFGYCDCNVMESTQVIKDNRHD
ncbi:hypothetical protein HPP92_004655 [Vanilla planifolia]|uniref:Uncharacterized protein n=1 Tax=Vanilla planifolia TaxID=51239 RepID=A0A835VEN5_VANPL|nr:hypothetical protein HPP92_004655 [Vanilla planifolia]